MPTPESKTCTRCGETKPLSEYYFEKGRPRARCKTCHRAALDARPPERIKEIAALTRANNREVFAARERERRAEKGGEINRQRRYANAQKPKRPERQRDPAKAMRRREWKRVYNREYYKRNPEKFEVYRRRREAKKAGVLFIPYTRREIFDRDGGRCRECGIVLLYEPHGFQIDHIVPISLGGHDTPANVQLMCAPCNRGKWATITQTYLPV